MAEGVIKITATEHVYNDSKNPDSTYATTPIKLRYSDYGLDKKEAYIKFDISKIPQGKQITGITMFLYVSSASSSAATELSGVGIQAGFNRTEIPGLTQMTYNKTNGLPIYWFGGILLFNDVNRPGYGSVELKKTAVTFANAYKRMLERALVIHIPITVDMLQSSTFTADIAGATTSNPPYLLVNYEDIDFTAHGYPSAGFVDRTKPATFEWVVNPDPEENMWGDLTAAGATIYYRSVSSSAYSSVIATGDKYTFAANTLPSGDVEWYAEVTTNAGTTATTPTNIISTVDAVAVSAPLSPVNQKLNRDEANVFTWNHSTENGTAQTAADLQYSVDNLTWQNLATVAGSQQSATIAAGTLPIGTVFWRVRTYNANGVAGEWSNSAVITVVGAVPVPTIASIGGNAMPVISWSAQIQQAYQVQIQNESGIIFESGAQLGTAKAYNIETLLPDGQYTAQVRVYADNGTASAWAASPFVISTIKPTAPVISAQSGMGHVTLTVNADSSDTVYILRDGIPIGVAQDGTFNDYSGVGQSKYIARAVSSDNRYADSAPVTAEPIIIGSVIAAADDLSKSVSLMLNLGGMPSREFNWSPIGSIAHYAGRKYPDYQYTEQEEESYNFSFAFRIKAEFDAFMELCKKRGTVLYRDQYGLKLYGIITGVSPNIQWAGWAVTFSMTRVDYSEAVSYV